MLSHTAPYLAPPAPRPSRTRARDVCAIKANAVARAFAALSMPWVGDDPLARRRGGRMIDCDNYLVEPNGVSECLHKTEKKIFVL